jgi:hypothetical protein
MRFQDKSHTQISDCRKKATMLMNQPYLSPDDQPSSLTIQMSGILLRQLEETTKQSFYKSCDRTTRILLAHCHWYFKTNTGVLMLVMICPDIEIYRHIIKVTPQFIDKLKLFANKYIISVSPPVEKGIPFIISVDEPEQLFDE